MKTRIAFATFASINAFSLVFVVGCQRPSSTLARANEKPATASARSIDETDPNDQQERTEDTIDVPEHWLVIKKAVNVETETRAEGEFDARRNKISIATKNVAEFTLDAADIPIDWSRLVIISIDGVNAELRQRDYSPLLFHREGFSSWSVVEP